MSEKVKEILRYCSESHSIDYKKLQYPIVQHAKKHELIKDISAMANHPSDEDKYIIIGVKEKNGIASDFYDVTDLVDQAKYQQFINSYIEPEIHFEYKLIDYNNHQLAYFRIYDNKDRPYLIKKEVRNFADNKIIEFREGDGFIRVGTSTKKITRTGFDKIYEFKHKKVDRKSDLKITPYFGIPDNSELSMLKVKYLDISIENTSKHSIDIDVEMRVFKETRYKLISEYELKQELNKQERKNSNIFGIQISPIEMPSFHVDIEELSDSVVISRTRMRNQRTAITISQKGIEKDVFCQYLLLLVLKNEPKVIKAELTIRSDDFTEGVLIENIEFRPK